MQDYESVRAAVRICATPINIQIDTHRQHSGQLVRIVQAAELKMWRFQCYNATVDESD